MSGGHKLEEFCARNRRKTVASPSPSVTVDALIFSDRMVLCQMSMVVVLFASCSAIDTCRPQYVPLGGNCNRISPKFCTPGSICDDSTPSKACRLPPGASGCGTNNNYCAGASVCMDNICGLPPGASGCGTNNNYCAGASVCMDNICSGDKGFIFIPHSRAQQVITMDLSPPHGYTIFNTPDQSNHQAIGYDSVEEKIYYSDFIQDTVRTVNFDGSNKQTLLTGTKATALVVDPLSRLLFFTHYDVSVGYIGLMAIDGGHVKTVLPGRSKPYKIAVDVEEGKIYWSEIGNVQRILRADYDGSGVETVVDTTGRFPLGLALDKTGGVLFWADYLGPITSISLNDFSVQQVIHNEQGFGLNGLALYNDYLYVCSTTQGIGIKRLPKAGGSMEQVGPTTFYPVYDLHLHANGYGPQENGCSGGDHGCSRICIPTSGLNYQCLCPDDWTLDTSNNKTCNEN